MKKSLLLSLTIGLSMPLAHARAPADNLPAAQQGTVLYHNATLINPATKQQLIRQNVKTLTTPDLSTVGLSMSIMTVTPCSSLSTPWLSSKHVSI
ncbi:hypothetical protein QE250_00130 [Chromatiaceae bacterium AAb-1]|nr:hypothetical protein [Chromatiaceae bacterium AAb-1]